MVMPINSPALSASLNNSAGTTTKNAVGVIIPLTGKWESIGQKILKGIETADGIFMDGPGTNVEYIIRDYGNDEDSIPLLIKDLDDNHHVTGIIGPVGEHAGDIACKEAQERHLPSIVFTQAEMPPRPGTYCFRNFLTIDLQAKALLSTARSMGITRFAVMIPDDRFGKTFAEKFQHMAPSFGISVVRTIGYSPTNVDFKQQLKTLFPAPKKTPSPGKPGEKPLNRGSDFDAIFVPDTAANAAMIASYLSYLNIRNIRLFGPTLWDTPDLLRVGGKNVENAVFLSGFYQGTVLSAAREFNTLFSSTFHYAPSSWEASAYDTARILQVFLQSQPPSRDGLREYLKGLKNYPGVSGTTSFSPDGALDKTVYILTVKDNAIYEIHP